MNKIRHAIFGLQANKEGYLVFDFELLEKVGHVGVLREICGVWVESFLKFLNEIFVLGGHESEL